MVSYCGKLAIRSGNFKEQDFANNQPVGMPKALITSVRKLDNGCALRNQKTLDIRNLLSNFGDIPIVVNKKDQETPDAIDKVGIMDG